ncbi:MAG: hypothetical protein KDA78_15135, partial [Planctomycetaceae bacterium]|nr:hypothetical protein [Planctomycetaceae bacterium]
MVSPVTIHYAGICFLVLFTNSLLSAADQPAFDRSVRNSDNAEPSIPHPEQEQAVTEKLTQLRERTGRLPNIVWLVV